MVLIERRVSDRAMLKLLAKVGPGRIIEGGVLGTSSGTPQGSPISPLPATSPGASSTRN